MSGRAIFLSLAFIVALGWLASRWLSSAIPPPEQLPGSSDGGPAAVRRSTERSLAALDQLTTAEAPSVVAGADAGFGGPPPAAGDAGTAELVDKVRAAVAFGQVGAFLADNAQAAEQHVEEFCQQSKLLQQERPFGEESPRSKDASRFMTVRVDWEDGVRPPGLLDLSAPLSQRLRAYGEDWPTRVTGADLQGLDFSWLEQLRDYDHWNVITGDGPLRDAKDADWFQAPLPNFVVLMQWAKLRLAQGLATGQLAQASAEVRHLAALLHSTDVLVGDMVAVMLLRYERRAHDVAQAAGQDVSGWQGPSTEALDRYRALGRNAMYFAYPGVSPEVTKKAMACNATSKCAAWYEGNGARATLQRWVRDDGRAFSSMLGESGCDPQVLRRFSQVRPLEPDEAVRNFAGGSGAAGFLPDAGR